MNNKTSVRITSTNKRERTITITKYNSEGKPYAKYRSNTLPKEEFNYYEHYATEDDIKNFLKSDDYYEIRRN